MSAPHGLHIYRPLRLSEGRSLYHPYNRSENCRWLCWQMDHGICRRCGLNANDLQLAIGHVYGKCARGEWNLNFYSFRQALPKPFRRWPRPLWEADHITPISMGGTDHPNNLRTLCVACHAIMTREIVRSEKGRRIRAAHRLEVEFDPDSQERPLSDAARQCLANERLRQKHLHARKSTERAVFPQECK